MPVCLVLFADGSVGLRVVRFAENLRFLVVRLTAGLEKILHEIEIFLFARGFVHFIKSKLDFLVPRRVERRAVLDGEHLRDVIGVFLHDAEEAAAARRVVIRAGGLHEVPGAVELVAVPV